MANPPAYLHHDGSKYQNLPAKWIHLWIPRNSRCYSHPQSRDKFRTSKHQGLWQKKDVWNLWFFKPYPRGNDGTYDQISVLWNFRIYILFKTIQLISTRKLLDSSPSQSQASAVAKSISPSFRSLTNMKRKHLHKPHKPHKVAPFLMHASGLQCIFWVSQAMPSQCVHW